MKNTCAQFEAIARAKPIPANDQTKALLLAHLLFTRLQQGMYSPSAAPAEYPEPFQWMAILLTSTAIAKQMQGVKKQKSLGNWLFKQSEAAYMAFSEATYYAQTRKRDLIVMTGEQLELQRKFLRAYTMVMPVLTIGQWVDGAWAAEHGLAVFQEVMMK